MEVTPVSTTDVFAETAAAPFINLSKMDPDKAAECYLLAVDQLDLILDAFAAWRDFLSKRLHKWGEKTVNPPKIYPSPEAFLEHAKKRINRLKDDILSNPMDPAILSKPKLEDDWVWEEWLEQDYALKSQIVLGHKKSPFTGKPISTVPHLFAQAMIEWSALLQFGPASAQPNLIQGNPQEVTGTIPGNEVALQNTSCKKKQKKIADAL